LSLEELPLTLPPMFAEACGYQGRARYIALCWIPELGELWWSDDGEATLGDSRVFRMLFEHPATSEALGRYREEATRDQVRPWLLIDRDRRKLSMGPLGDVWSTIGDQDGRRRLGRGPAIDPRRQLELERAISTWLDWMGKRVDRT
jgi:hypothetical protein